MAPSKQRTNFCRVWPSMALRYGDNVAVQRGARPVLSPPPDTLTMPPRPPTLAYAPVAMPHPDWGEAVHAEVVLRKEIKVSAAIGLCELLDGPRPLHPINQEGIMNRAVKLVIVMAAVVAFWAPIINQALADATSLTSPDLSSGLLLRGTVVTMDDQHSVIEDGRVLVRSDRIVAIWQHEQPPGGTAVAGAVTIDLGPSALIFPGLINLHNHPTYDVLRLWPAPSSDVQPGLGRPVGTEPYANRYQWNGTFASSPEYRRLVETPQLALVSAQGLGLEAEMVKYSAIEALFGGETTTEGALPRPETDGLLARNVESTNFGRQRIDARVPSIDSFDGADLANLLERMKEGQLDGWLIHLAEGVRDADRRPDDTFSSRGEFATLKSKALLTDMTVILHGTALEPSDFAEMRAAPSIRLDGTGDGLGAKLVWTPLSNLLLYGETTNVYQAVAASVIVSLGTDWSPSGTRNLLGELKVADIALRDPSLLGNSRSLIPELSVIGKQGQEAALAEIALDRLLVDMVTRNPAMTVRWQDEVGSIETGKVADLFIITEPAARAREGLPSSPYRSLIDATERDVRLVLVGGDPLVGDIELMQRLKPDQYEIINSDCACYQKALVAGKVGIPKGDETLADIQQKLNEGLVALGGDNPPAGGGPANPSNTYSYLKQHFTLPFPMTDAQFMQLVLIPFAGTAGGNLNLERLTLTPLLQDEDEFFFDLLGIRTNLATGLLADPTPPFMLYRSNPNQEQNGIDPYEAAAYEDRWYPLMTGMHPQSLKLEDEPGDMCFAHAQAACPRQ
jgi:5-methylthioadenosine/S-adenosylhomocysteine deaminase